MSLLYLCWLFLDTQLGALSKTENFESFIKSSFPNDKDVVKTVRAYLQIWTGKPDLIRKVCFNYIHVYTLYLIFFFFNLSWVL